MNTRRTVLAGAAAACLAPTFASAHAQGVPQAGGRATNSNQAAARVPGKTLNNGVVMPQLGYGTWSIAAERADWAVESAITTGFRSIDTATNYSNEAGVGDDIIASGVPRDQLFVTTKLWIEDFGHDEALRAFDRSMADLKLDYLDLYLLHWPVPGEFDRTIAAYKAVEQLHAQGRIRAIGVSNFNPNHLDRLMTEATILPAVNQIEINPHMTQTADRAENARRGIATESWSPLGSHRNVGRILANPAIVAIASAHEKSPAQVAIRWQLQHDLIIIPRSTNPAHMAENIDVFDFELTPWRWRRSIR